MASLAVSGCGRTHPPQLGADPSSTATTPTGPADQLAGLAAAGLDRKYVAAYAYHVAGRADRTVVVSVANDGTWSVNVPGGALSGGADVSIIGNKTGVYQCVLGGPATTAAVPNPSPSVPASPSPGASPSMSPTPTGPVYTAPACYKVAAAGHNVPSAYDPLMEHVFTNWLTAMSSRTAAISVFSAAPLPGSRGTCYSVEPSAASLAPVVDAGIFCFLPDGSITAVKLAAGTLTLEGNQAVAAPTNPLPAAVLTTPAAPVHAPAP
jgi:hypothetical protein